MGYKTDRNFDEIAWHSEADKQFRAKYGLREMTLDEIRTIFPEFDPTLADNQFAIDHVLYCELTGNIIFEQTRFRRQEYASRYNDATLRWTRMFSQRPGEHQSELYKLQRVVSAHPNVKFLLFYGFYDEANDRIDKMAIIDLMEVSKRFATGHIQPMNLGDYSKPTYNPVTDTMTASTRKNPDKSSEFITIEPTLLNQMKGPRSAWMMGVWNGREYHDI